MDFNEPRHKLTHDRERQLDSLRVNPANKNFKPGTCVRIEGFVEKPKYNGMLGQVKRLVDGDTYRVMLSSEKNDFAIDAKFLVGINQCVSSNRITGGILVWPDVARSNFPAVQHFDDDGFREKFVNPFRHSLDQLGSNGLNVDRVRAVEQLNLLNNRENLDKIEQSFFPLFEIFKKRLGWIRPISRAQIQSGEWGIARGLNSVYAGFCGLLLPYMPNPATVYFFL